MKQTTRSFWQVCYYMEYWIERNLLRQPTLHGIVQQLSSIYDIWYNEFQVVILLKPIFICSVIHIVSSSDKHIWAAGGCCSILVIYKQLRTQRQQWGDTIWLSSKWDILPTLVLYSHLATYRLSIWYFWVVQSVRISQIVVLWIVPENLTNNNQRRCYQ